MGYFSDRLEEYYAYLDEQERLKTRERFLREFGTGGWTTEPEPRVIAPEPQVMSKTVTGLNPEAGGMASQETLQTMRATGGFAIPESLKGMLPLLLVFLLVVFIILKK